MNIKKALSCIAVASFLTIIPVKNIYAQDKSYTVEIPGLEGKKEILDYAVRLATDLDDDGKPDKIGYETLFQKLKIKYDQNQTPKKLQEQIQSYITKLETKDQLDQVAFKVFSMFTEKDSELFFNKTLEVISKELEEIEKRLEDVIKEYPKN